MVLASGPAREAASHKSKAMLDFALGALRAGDIAGAELRLRDVLLVDPFNATALAKLAEIAVEQRRIEEATVLLRKAVTADPSPERRLDLIAHLQRFAGPGLVLNELQELPPEVRSRHEVKAIEAGTRGVLGEHDEQIRIYQEMVRERPRQPGLWMSLGNALKTTGRVDEAVDALRQRAQGPADLRRSLLDARQFQVVPLFAARAQPDAPGAAQEAPGRGRASPPFRARQGV